LENIFSEEFYASGNSSFLAKLFKNNLFLIKRKLYIFKSIKKLPLSIILILYIVMEGVI